MYSWNVRDGNELDKEGILKKWRAACKLPGFEGCKRIVQLCRLSISLYDALGAVALGVRRRVETQDQMFPYARWGQALSSREHGKEGALTFVKGDVVGSLRIKP